MAISIILSRGSTGSSATVSKRLVDIYLESTGYGSHNESPFTFENPNRFQV